MDRSVLKFSALEIFVLNTRYLFVLWVTGCLLSLPPGRHDKLSELLPPSLRAWTAVATIFLFFLWFVETITCTYKKKQQRQEIHGLLHTLSAAEFMILAHCVRHGQRTIRCNNSHSIITLLCEKGLLKAAGHTSQTDAVTDWPHTVPGEVWTELMHEREKILATRDNHLRALPQDARAQFRNIERTLCR